MARFERAVQAVFSLAGLHVQRLRKYPGHSLLGLRYCDVRTIFDVGANRGQFAQSMLPIFQRAKIYSFEPQPEPFAVLNRWARTTGGKVRAFNCALGADSGVVAMSQHVEHDPSTSILGTTDVNAQLYPQTARQRQISVSQRMLDDVIAVEGLRLDDKVLLKMDVQGYEDRVLAGAPKLLGQVHACITEICLDPLYHDQAKFESLVEVLLRNGLRYAGNMSQVMADDGHVIYCDAIFVRAGG